jgi:hypothetical protein
VLQQKLFEGVAISLEDGAFSSALQAGFTVSMILPSLRLCVGDDGIEGCVPLCGGEDVLVHSLAADKATVSKPQGGWKIEK